MAAIDETSLNKEDIIALRDDDALARTREVIAARGSWAHQPGHDHGCAC